MSNKFGLMIITAALGLATGIGIASAEPVCNTTTSNKCTSSGESCTKTVKVCTTFRPDGHTEIATTTSHDCGPDGPKDCAGSGSGSAAAHSHFASVSSTTVKMEDTATPKPKFPVKRVDSGAVLDKGSSTPTPTPSSRTTGSRGVSQKKNNPTPTPTPTPSDRNKKGNKNG